MPIQPEVLTMKAILMEDFGGAEQLKAGRREIPQPGPGEVQIQIAYTAVNPVDWKIRAGLLQNRLPHHFPLIPGWDAAGIISTIGQGVTKFKVGDQVFAYCRKPVVEWGTYAEYVCYEAENVAFKPTHLSFAQAAAIPLAGLTAWQALFDTAELKRGETVLIHAGAGGVGSLAIQFAKLAGAYVLTTAREANHAYVKSLGADVAIDYHIHPVDAEVKKKVPEGVDVVFDTIGGQTLADSFAFLKPGGRLVTIVEPPSQELAEHFKVKALYLFVSPNGKELQHIADLLQEGKVKPIKIEEMPLESAGEAQEKNRQRHTPGKIVLKVQDI
jgi:NADPH2:quinone reductase